MLAQVNLVQADNLSWFGYPEDPVPSVRATLLPGITQASLLPMAFCAFSQCCADTEVRRQAHAQGSQAADVEPRALWQAQERTGKLPEPPPPAVVPPASIAGDELSIEALTAARRAVRAQQRLAKQAGAPPAAVQQQPAQPLPQHEQPLAQHFSLLHPQHSTTVLSASAPQQAAEAPTGSRSATDAADGVGTGTETSTQHGAEDEQPDGQDVASSDAAVAGQEAPVDADATADRAALQPRTQLQRQLQQLRLQSSCIPLDKQPQAVMQRQMGILTRPATSGAQTDSQLAGTRPPAVAPQATEADQPAPEAAAGTASTSDGAAAAPAVAEAQDAAAPAAPGAAGRPSDSGADAEASRTAWQRIMHSMASAPTTVRGGMDASWQTLQSLPQTLPRALPRAVPQSLPRLPWQPPLDSSAVSPVEAQQPTAQQRLMDQISVLELRPTAQDVLPDLPGAMSADSRATSNQQPQQQQKCPVPVSQARASAATLLQAEASASQPARDEAATAFAALGDCRAASPVADSEHHGQHGQPASRVEAWRDGQRMRSVRFGRER